MSHASLIVALSPADIGAAGNINAAIAHQMAPFDEDGEWGGEGSRWDWWSIGGRYTGKFSEPGYLPHLDPKNFKQCWLCNGGGLRNDALGLEHRRTDPTYTCNGCGGTGRMLNHAGDWRDVGNVITRAELTEERCREKASGDAEAKWPHLAKDIESYRTDPRCLSSIWGDDITPQTTREQFLSREQAEGLTAYAFLKDRQWHECDRLGMFAMSRVTECEIKAEEQGVEFAGRCIHERPEQDARIITWTGPKDSDEKWNRLFYARFIGNLPMDYTLVVVDYHV